MPFSLGSYLLGVATVVGALAFGFGSGVLITKTAMKETTTPSTRVERVARSEPEPAAPAQQQDAKDNSPPPAQPSPAAAAPVPAAQAAEPPPAGRSAAAKEPEPS